MSSDRAPQARIDRYIESFSAGLRSLPAEQARDIVQEIRSHIRDSICFDGAVIDASVSAVLSRLGPPSALASSYVAENLAAQSRRSLALGLPVKSGFRCASVFLFTLAGYGLAAGAGICALAKLINPERAGLWKLDEDNFSLHLGFGPAPAAPSAHELLGWWIIPLALILGAGLALLTTEIGLRTILAARTRRPHPASGYFGEPS